MIFNPDGSLTADGLKACKVMKVSPEQLTVVSEDDLKRQGVPEHIAKVRVKHMAEKRSNRIYMLENCIRSGMITQL